MRGCLSVLFLFHFTHYLLSYCLFYSPPDRPSSYPVICYLRLSIVLKYQNIIIYYPAFPNHVLFFASLYFALFILPFLIYVLSLFHSCSRSVVCIHSSPLHSIHSPSSLWFSHPRLHHQHILTSSLPHMYFISTASLSLPASRCRPCPGTLDGAVSIENRLRDSYVKQYSFE